MSNSLVDEVQHVFGSDFWLSNSGQAEDQAEDAYAPSGKDDQTEEARQESNHVDDVQECSSASVASRVGALDRRSTL
jgi:hypothetical protein